MAGEADSGEEGEVVGLDAVAGQGVGVTVVRRGGEGEGATRLSRLLRFRGLGGDRRGLSMGFGGLKDSGAERMLDRISM